MQQDWPRVWSTWPARGLHVTHRMGDCVGLAERRAGVGDWEGVWGEWYAGPSRTHTHPPHPPTTPPLPPPAPSTIYRDTLLSRYE
eukprot:990759-Rhodomonas_salina.1